LEGFHGLLQRFWLALVALVDCVAVLVVDSFWWEGRFWGAQLRWLGVVAAARNARAFGMEGLRRGVRVIYGDFGGLQYE